MSGPEFEFDMFGGVNMNDTLNSSLDLGMFGDVGVRYFLSDIFIFIHHSPNMDIYFNIY